MFPDKIPQNLLDYNPMAQGSPDVPFHLFLRRDLEMNLPSKDDSRMHLLLLDASDFSETRYESIDRVTLSVNDSEGDYSVDTSVDVRLPGEIGPQDFSKLITTYLSELEAHPVFESQSIRVSQHPTGLYILTLMSDGARVARAELYKRNGLCKIRMSQETPTISSTHDVYDLLENSVAVLSKVCEGVAKAHTPTAKDAQKVVNVLIGTTSRGTVSDSQLSLMTSLDAFNVEHNRSIVFGPDTNGGKLDAVSADANTIARAVLEILSIQQRTQIMQHDIELAIDRVASSNG